MQLSRRSLARAAALAAGAGAASRTLTDHAATALGAGRRAPATLGRVLVKGSRGRRGYRKVTAIRGQGHVLRTGLGVRPERGRLARRRGVMAFAQLSDVHVVDAQSPLRVEWTDRFDDPSALPTLGLFASAYRAHEMLTAHVADAMVRSLNAVGHGPVTGKPIALAIQTGDNSDNSQHNEIRWNIDVLDGERVRPDSGSHRRWEGVADDDPLYYDRAYWHPDGPPAGREDDAAMTRYGFPRVKGLLDAARRPFRAAGLDMPWYTAFGNHDGLVQGNFPATTLQLNAIATGPLKVISPPAGLSPAALVNALTDGDLGALLGSLVLSPAARLVTPDRDRRLLSRKEIVEAHFHTSGLPRGHGFTEANRRRGTAYYTFDKGRCRFIVLDTVNPNGYADGSIDQTQFDWLEKVVKRSAHKITMVFSHHTSSTMNNPLIATGLDLEPRVTGDAVLDLLLDHPQVVAWVNGHTHRNEISPRRRGRHGGLWEINTASHIDWPQQSRVIEIVDNRDGTLSLFTTMVDHAGPASFRGDLSDTTHLAALARELAANDWHNPTDAGRGTRRDRNAELVVQRPPGLRPR